MNLLLHPDPAICEQFLALLGVAAGLASVDDEGGFTLITNNEIARNFYRVEPLPRPVKLTVENIAPLLHGVRDPGQVEAYVGRMQTNYRACAEQGRTLSTETDMQSPDGVERWSRNTLTPIFEGERVARILVTFVEVTEIREARTELERSLTSLIASMIDVCQGCGKVADNGSWVTMAHYMRRHSDRSFSDGICPACTREHFGRAR